MGLGHKELLNNSSLKFYVTLQCNIKLEYAVHDIDSTTHVAEFSFKGKNEAC